MNRLKDLIQLLKNLIDLNFTGSVEVHFNQGAIGRIIKHERVK